MMLVHDNQLVNETWVEQMNIAGQWNSYENLLLLEQKCGKKRLNNMQQNFVNFIDL